MQNAKTGIKVITKERGNMSKTNQDMLRVSVNVFITADALQAVVANAKKMAGRGAKGSYLVDTADKVSEMITRFLEEKDFEGYVKDINNY